ncbi:MAG: hypothetical protein RLZZ282_1566 [Verrucomicrobiota bacterium]
MADVDHHVFAEIAADSAGSGGLGIGWADEIADLGDDVVAFEHQGDDRGALHEGEELREDRDVGDVGVVIAQDRLVELHHFDGADDKSRSLEAGQDGAGQVFFNRVGL